MLLHVPSGNWGRHWKSHLLRAVRHTLVEAGDPPPIDLGALENDDPNPLERLAAGVSTPASGGAKGLLSCFGQDPAVTFFLDAPDGLRTPWCDALREMARVCRTLSTIERVRGVLALVHARPGSIGLRGEVGALVLSLWGIVRPEELRLVADDCLQHNENALVRAWRLATYCGASNCDQQFLEHLCAELPASIGAVLEAAAVRHGAESNVDIPTIRGTVAQHRHQVPRALEEGWLNGAFSDYTFDRGVQLTWAALGDDVRDDYIRRAIWREQIATLFPLIAELATQCAVAAEREFGVSFSVETTEIEGADDSPAALRRAFPEPSRLLQAITHQRAHRGAGRVTELLRQLDRARNLLAHARVVELVVLHRLWAGFDHVRSRYAFR